MTIGAHYPTCIWLKHSAIRKQTDNKITESERKGIVYAVSAFCEAGFDLLEVGFDLGLETGLAFAAFGFTAADFAAAYHGSVSNDTSSQQAIRTFFASVFLLVVFLAGAAAFGFFAGADFAAEAFFAGAAFFVALVLAGLAGAAFFAGLAAGLVAVFAFASAGLAFYCTYSQHGKN